jgi:hypothetical protein
VGRVVLQCVAWVLLGGQAGGISLDLCDLGLEMGLGS